ncbi:MAG: putative Fe-S cluster assembly protein SufT [Methylacidiphilales bacterium]|nr:putative Fe-S cluster assembly protein SufT [Candidatus Methylacidiphilales bacterium]MDW8349907.1 putative Fe-S cluster assembly protein SufT [Verrucomicrobiae bacterium]
MPTELVKLIRDCPAIRIPTGEPFTLAAGTEGYITQRLGDTITLAFSGGLARVEAKDADALGLKVSKEEQRSSSGEGPTEPPTQEALLKALKNVYDPEIPVNIVDLGLVYSAEIFPVGEDRYRAEIKMTLTAPGCGMGPVISADVQKRALSVPGIVEANVELVWDPPWNQSMMSELGKMQLGLI